MVKSDKLFMEMLFQFLGFFLLWKDLKVRKLTWKNSNVQPNGLMSGKFIDC